LIVDYSRGNPLPVGGLDYDGGTHVVGDSLYVVGTAGADRASMTTTRVVLAGSAAINYSNAQFFAFDLGAGLDSLNLLGATLRTNQDDAISDGTAVTISRNGILDLGGRTEYVRAVTIVSGSVINGTLLVAPSAVVGKGTVPFSSNESWDSSPVSNFRSAAQQPQAKAAAGTLLRASLGERQKRTCQRNIVGTLRVPDPHTECAVYFLPPPNLKADSARANVPSATAAAFDAAIESPGIRASGQDWSGPWATLQDRQRPSKKAPRWDQAVDRVLAEYAP